MTTGRGASLRHIYLAFHAFQSSVLGQSQTRHASTTSAITAGLRATRQARRDTGRLGGRFGDRKPRDIRLSPRSSADVRTSRRLQPIGEERGSKTLRPRQSVDEPIHPRNTSSFKPLSRARTFDQDIRGRRLSGHRESRLARDAQTPWPQSPTPSSRHSSLRTTRNRPPPEDNIPVSIPYSSASSQFLYGFNIVRAALQAKRRSIYKLYVAEKQGMLTNNTKLLIELASQARIPINHQTDLAFLDRISGGRPHNGVVLEASPVAAPAISSLNAVETLPDGRRILSAIPHLAHPSPSSSSPAPLRIPLGRNSHRHPLILMLDGILDEGNLGNILRTAHFYGVDAVAIATNTCAPLTSSVMLKASSGASEAVRILALPKPAGFVYESIRAGWRVYASVAPASASGRGQDSSRDGARRMTTQDVARNSPLADGPAILMLGAEGEGLRDNLTSKAHFLLSIPRGYSDFSVAPQVGVDSLNVGVAAGILLDSFLRVPLKNRKDGYARGKNAQASEATSEDEGSTSTKMW